MPKLDPLVAAQEEALHFKEGNRKLGLAVEAMREALETIVSAEWDHKYGRPVSPDDLRAIATDGLDRYSGIVGQSWRRYRLTGASLAGHAGNQPVHERDMRDVVED